LQSTLAAVFGGAETRRDLDNVLPALAAGLPAKVLVQTDDLLEPSPIGGELLGLALHSRQLVNAAIGIGGFCVLQSSASHLPRFREKLLRALACPGPALLTTRMPKSFSNRSARNGRSNPSAPGNRGQAASLNRQRRIRCRRLLESGRRTPDGSSRRTITPRCTSCNECIQINGKMFGLRRQQAGFDRESGCGQAAES
jgi:hypothetical protein